MFNVIAVFVLGMLGGMLPNPISDSALRAYDAGDTSPAIAEYRQRISQNPQDFASLMWLGRALMERGEFAESLRALDAAASLAPSHPLVRGTRAESLLMSGDYSRGWEEYEWRLKMPWFQNAIPPGPSWDGRSPVTIIGEQGSGDVFQFYRYLPLVKERCSDVEFACQRNLPPFLSIPENKVTPTSCLVPADDRQRTALGSLPYLLNLPRPEQSPQPPYLFASKPLVDLWANRLEPYREFRVGICWQGNPTYLRDQWRSIPLDAFKPLSKVSGVKLVSLQKNPGTDIGRQIDEQSGAFMDSAAILHNIDMLVTCDTSLAHLAGAMNRPVWVALCASPDWRWGFRGETTPWYPSMRLFRQSRLGDWSSVFHRIASELKSKVEGT
jgi:hypothetical protein